MRLQSSLEICLVGIKKNNTKKSAKPRAQVVVPAFIFDVPCKGKMKPIYYRQPL